VIENPGGVQFLTAGSYLADGSVGEELEEQGGARP
jgi:hypothetical protein